MFASMFYDYYPLYDIAYDAIPTPRRFQPRTKDALYGMSLEFEIY